MNSHQFKPKVNKIVTRGFPFAESSVNNELIMKIPEEYLTPNINTSYPERFQKINENINSTLLE